MKHEEYMRRALELAKRGEGQVAPNPMVGCVVVKDGTIISEAWHEHIGEFHAERNALLKCGDAEGADLYVTLEPCCHYGRTPPCTDIIIEKKIARVFIASMDPNPLVAGKGAKLLEEAGIEVHRGILEKEAMELNEQFFWFISNKTPFIAVKYAMSLDGKIACHTGDSKWITNEESRKYVHELRRQYAGILVGIGTVLADNPLLTCRTYEGVNPVRIVLDSRLRLPLDSNLMKTAKETPVLVYCGDEADAAGQEQMRNLTEAGAEVTVISGTPGRQEFLKKVTEDLGRRQISSVLIEGGGEVNAQALEAGLVNRVYAFIGNKIIGGKEAKSPVSGIGAASMKEVSELADVKLKQFGNDIMITGLLERG